MAKTYEELLAHSRGLAASRDSLQAAYEIKTRELEELRPLIEALRAFIHNEIHQELEDR